MADKNIINIDPAGSCDLDHLFYEIQMLNETANYQAKDRLENNAFLESFLVHARILINFLRGTDNWLDDIKISDFKDNNGLQLNSVLVDLDSDLIVKINKHLQHLSKKRAEEKFGWFKMVIKEKINDKLKEFLNNIGDNYFIDAKYKKEDFFKLLNK